MTVTLRTDHAGDGVEVGAEAVVFCGAGRPLERIGVPAVVLRPGEALVRVDFVSLCPDDVRLLSGLESVRLPFVPGHEQVGRVVAVAGVRPPRDVDGHRLLVGDRVIWASGVGCGRCAPCRAGSVASCLRLHRYGRDRVARGWELSGGCATHVQVLARTPVVRVPDDLPDADAAAASHEAFTARELADNLCRGSAAVDAVFAFDEAQHAIDAALADPTLRIGLRPGPTR